MKFTPLKSNSRKHKEFIGKPQEIIGLGIFPSPKKKKKTPAYLSKMVRFAIVSSLN